MARLTILALAVFGLWCAFAGANPLKWPPPNWNPNKWPKYKPPPPVHGMDANSPESVVGSLGNQCVCHLPYEDPDYRHKFGEEFADLRPELGWMMGNEDRTCRCGQICPYACKPGFIPWQWDLDHSNEKHPFYTLGMLCNPAQRMTWKAEHSRPLCQDARGEVDFRTEIHDTTVACQTINPGSAKPLVPYEIKPGSVLDVAIPNSRSYHAMDHKEPMPAQYYINTPGLHWRSVCTWGNSTAPSARGIYAPYRVDVVRKVSGHTEVELRWNPLYVQFYGHKRPKFGVQLRCTYDGGECATANGTCVIDPLRHLAGEMDGALEEPGSGLRAGQPPYCKTITSGSVSQLSIVIFDARNKCDPEGWGD